MKFIIIREYRTNDKFKYNELKQNGIMSNLGTAFWAAITREVTFQLIVLTAAIMFIFFGVPLTFCIGAVPIVMVLIYFAVFTAHWMKAAEESSSQKFMHCLVAEAYEPFLFTRNPKEVAYTVLTEKEANFKNIDSGSHQRKLVGTISIDKHRNRHYSSWLHSLAVDINYRRKGVGAALICAAVRYCEVAGFESVECTTTECQDAARQVFLNAGFQLAQMYHKRLAFASLEKYQMCLELSPPL